MVFSLFEIKCLKCGSTNCTITVTATFEPDGLACMDCGSEESEWRDDDTTSPDVGSDRRIHDYECKNTECSNNLGQGFCDADKCEPKTVSLGIINNSM